MRTLRNTLAASAVILVGWYSICAVVESAASILDVALASIIF